jgi:ribosomal-protein-alanine N-acetyltransferase
VTSGSKALRIEVRAMMQKDIERVHQIDVASFSLPWPVRSYRFELEENQASRLYVAEVKNEHGETLVVGMVVLWFILDEAHIGTFAIDAAYRRQGIGRRLLAESLLQAYNNGVRRCFLEVRRSNLAAQALYQIFGFHVATIRPRYYRDNGEDALMMTLDPIRIDVLREFLQ